MQDLNDLFYFVQVVDHGGFAPAARALGEPKSKLSRRVAGLEERLGLRLLQRSTRTVSVTEIGRAYYTRCKAMLVEAEAAEEVVEQQRSEPCGVVRMTCPVALLETRVGDMLADFLAAYPRVELHLESTNRRVDVVTEGIDLAIRVRPPPLDDSDLVMRTLSDRAQCLAAGPPLLERLGAPQSPADLDRFPSVSVGGPQRHFHWNLIGPDGENVRVEHRPRFITHSMSALAAAAAAGVGIVQLPNMMITEQLQRGDLVRVLPDWAPPREIVHAVFASRRGLLPSVRALVDFLAARFAALDED
ncbi:MAG: LysR family transcriptional regulator [Halofilum sp. (in: g-proteobacteria)]|nr:LysR family transcriptional regulator [Halofilum sp. (in: g-proteobacteria)]